MKKVISVLVALLVLFTSMSVYATTPTVYSEGYLYYTVENGSVTIVGNFGSQAELTIPSSIGGYPVNKIAAGAFTGNANLTKITLPDTITEIEEGAVPSSGVTVEHTTDDTVTYVAENTTKSKQYTTLAAALSESSSGDTVKLLTDITGELYLIVPAGTTLDLNHCDITGAALFYGNGIIMDSASAAQDRGVVVASAYLLSNDQAYTPVYNTALGGYHFIKLRFSDSCSVSGNSISFTLANSGARAYAYEALKNKAEDKEFSDYVKVYLDLSWNEGSGSSEVHVDKTYLYKEAFISAVINSGGKGSEILFAATVLGMTDGATMQARYVFYNTNGSVLFTIYGSKYVYDSSNNAAPWSVAN